MALEERARQQDTVVDVHQFPTTTLAMTVRDLVVRPDATAGSFTITLPPVAEAKGMFFSIIAQYASNTDLITITNGNDSEVWDGDFTLNEKGRGVILYSDGMKWHFGSQHFTSSLVAGGVNLAEIHLIMDTDGAATVDALIVRMESTAVLGNSAGAIFAQANYSDADARVQGLSYAIGAEMILPDHATIGSGHYTCIDYEIGAGSTAAWPVTTVVSYMRFATWGTQTEVDDDAYWFTLAATTEVDHLVSVNGYTIRCRIEALGVGNKERFVVLSETQNTLHQEGNVLGGAHQMNIQATYDSGTVVEGAVAYFQGNMSAASAAVRSTVSIWTNLNEAPGAGGVTRNIDSGIYTAIDLSDHNLYGFFQDMSLGAGGAPTTATQLGFNHSGHALDAFIYADNWGAIAGSADDSGSGGSDGRIGVRVAGSLYWIPLYSQ